MGTLTLLNKFSLPSGEEYYIKTLCNEDYQVLTKYSEAEDKKMFFESLDILIKESIPNFDDFDIIEKIYTYLVFCFYNIKTEIHVSNARLGMSSQEIGIVTILNNIEEHYKQHNVSVSSENGISFFSKNPKSIFIEKNEIFVDYLSGINEMIYKGQNVKIESKNIESLKKNFPSLLLKLEKQIRRTIFVIDIFKGVPLNSLEVNFLSQDAFEIVLQIYKDSMSNFYELLYTAIEYLKISYTDFMKMSPIEVSIILNRFVKDKKEQEEAFKEKNNR